MKTSLSGRDTIAHHEHLLAELDEEIADTASANEKRQLCERRFYLVAKHESRSKAAIWAEDISILEDFKLEARKRHQRREDLVKDKKRFFFTIWSNMSELSLQKVKVHLYRTVPVWLDLELNSQDPLILWNANKAITPSSNKITIIVYCPSTRCSFDAYRSRP